MIKPKPTRIGRFFWESFSKWGIKFCFHDFQVRGLPEIKSDHAVLLMGNHISWWDGFWPLDLNRRHIGKNYYVMMLEDQLAQRPFMREGGAFSINPGSRDMIESIKFAASLLGNPENLLLMYPQGEIRSMHDRKIIFQPGIEHILKRVKGNVQVLFFVALTDYGSHPRPTLTFYIRAYNGTYTTREMETFYSRFYQECLDKEIDLIAPTTN